MVGARARRTSSSRSGGPEPALSAAEWVSARHHRSDPLDVPDVTGFRRITKIAIIRQERWDTVNVSLTPRLEALIREKVDTGLYNNASEVVREALRLLEAKDRQLHWLREQIAVGDAQIASGDVIDVTENFWAELDADIDRRVARGDQPKPHVHS